MSKRGNKGWNRVDRQENIPGWNSNQIWIQHISQATSTKGNYYWTLELTDFDKRREQVIVKKNTEEGVTEPGDEGVVVEVKPGNIN